MIINKFAWVTVFLFVLLFSYSIASEKEDSGLIVLSKKNTVVLSDEVNGTSVGSVISATKKLDHFVTFGHKKPIYLFMNTPGGSIQSGLEMVEALKGINRPIDTVTLFSASMGFQIVQQLGKRLILKNGVLMSHRAYGKFVGNFGGQSPSQLESRLNLWNFRVTEMDTQTVKRSNGKQTLESYQKAYADELWLTGSQAVNGGYADQIVTVRCDSSLDGVTNHSVDFFGVRISYDLDNCPLNTSPMNVSVMVLGNKTTSEKNNELSVSFEKAEEMKSRFVEQYLNKQKSVIPMYW